MSTLVVVVVNEHKCATARQPQLRGELSEIGQRELASKCSTQLEAITKLRDDTKIHILD